jgi:hypothetical protein
MFEDRVLRRIVGSGGGGSHRGKCIMGSFIICTVQKIFLRRTNEGGWDRLIM